MTFLKDILIIDFEMTDIDPDKAEPIQLGAILLDKSTLAEKDSFISFIRSDLAGANPESLAVSGIKAEDLANAPSPAEVGRQFHEKFGADVFLSSWVEHLDRRMLKKVLTAAHLPYSVYDPHYLDLWPIAYVHLLKSGYSGGIRSEEIFQAFGFEKRANHEALSDCRLAAEVLRKIVNS